MSSSEDNAARDILTWSEVVEHHWSGSLKLYTEICPNCSRTIDWCSGAISGTSVVAEDCGVS